MHNKGRKNYYSTKVIITLHYDINQFVDSETDDVNRFIGVCTAINSQ